MPAFLVHAVSGWTAFYSGSAVMRTLVSFVHIAGLVGGGGAAITADRATLRATRRGLAITRQQLAVIHATHRIVVLGLAGVIVSGVLLFAADTDTYAVSKLFWLKMGIVAALMVNGAILVRIGRGSSEPDDRTRITLRRTAAVSLALWLLTTLAGAGLPNVS